MTSARSLSGALQWFWRAERRTTLRNPTAAASGGSAHRLGPFVGGRDAFPGLGLRREPHADDDWNPRTVSLLEHSNFLQVPHNRPGRMRLVELCLTSDSDRLAPRGTWTSPFGRSPRIYSPAGLGSPTVTIAVAPADGQAL